MSRPRARLTGLLVLLALLAPALVPAGALAQTFGREVQILEPRRPVSTGARIEVIEFFYYGCPICYEAQPHLSRWLLTTGEDVQLVRVPAVWKIGESFARTFYALQEMQLLARLHWPLYDNHHFDDRRLNEEKNLHEWLAGNGVDVGRFRALWHSPEMDARIEAVRRMLEAYDVRGVPVMVVDGRYLTSARLAGGVREMMQVTERMVARAREDRRAAAK